MLINVICGHKFEAISEKMDKTKISQKIDKGVCVVNKK